MIPAPADLAVTRLPGKYQLAQQLFHWAVAGLVLVLVASGLTMLVKIDSPLWRRNPYILSDGGWGLVTTVHDLGAMAVLALVLVHVYFALRPDKLWITRSMIRGWIRREDYLAHHDPRRWAGD